MTPKQQIQALESLGITRYRIACDTGISQAQLSNWASGKTKPYKTNSNVQKLTEFYEKIMEGMQK
jgi:transcriptional regulator with XRE-family HTH domain